MLENTTYLLLCVVVLVWTARCLEISVNSRILLMRGHYFVVFDAREATAYVWAKHMHVCLV